MKKIYQSARKSLRFRRPEIKEIRKINDAKDGSRTGRPTRAAGGLFDISRVLKIENPTETLGSCKWEIKDIKAETGDRECEPRGGKPRCRFDF